MMMEEEEEEEERVPCPCIIIVGGIVDTINSLRVVVYNKNKKI